MSTKNGNGTGMATKRHRLMFLLRPRDPAGRHGRLTAARASPGRPRGSAAASEFVSVSPPRVLRHRIGLGAPVGIVSPGTSIDVQVTGTAGGAL